MPFIVENIVELGRGCKSFDSSVHLFFTTKFKKNIFAVGKVVRNETMSFFFHLQHTNI